MTGAVNPQDIDCPDPGACPVIATLPLLETATLQPDRFLFRVYDGSWGYDEFSPGLKGDSRFAPIDDPLTGKRLPSMYLGETPTTVLLETVFHDVHEEGSGFVYEGHLHKKLLAHIQAPASATLGDLRDPQLDELGLARSQIVSSSAEHYPCTRRLAIEALAQGQDPPLQGLIWHFRQAELGGKPAEEVVVLFGGDRYPSKRGTWQRFGPGSQNLYEGPGRLLIDKIADDLRAIIEASAS
jgi:RES domain